MTCQCLSPACGAHRTIECPRQATVTLLSRDWDGGEYQMCERCAEGAEDTGMFERWE